MSYAVELAGRCPRSASAFAVGSVIVGPGGREVSAGWSRDTDALVHAEESALLKAVGVDLGGCTLYSTLEPCSKRAHRPAATCTSLILAARIPGVERDVMARVGATSKLKVGARCTLSLDLSAMHLFDAAGDALAHKA